MEFGSALKKIRVSRIIRQEELSQNLMSRTSISKIENLKQLPNYTNSVQLIERLGLTLNEFEFIKNNYSYSKKQTIEQQFMHIGDSTHQNDLLDLKERCLLYLKKDKDSDVKRIYLITKAMLEIDKKTMKELCPIVQPVWDYLSKIDTWVILDLYMINYIFFFFPSKTSFWMLRLALINIKEKYPELIKLKNSFLLNQSYLLMQGKKFSRAKSFLEESLTISKQTAQYDLLILAKIRICFCDNKENQITKLLILLHEMGANSLAEGIKEELKILKEIKNKAENQDLISR
ncbi:helix-turn-helix transcriptional regulator [Oenococcus sp. UCMA 17063]|nr:helix-turn-helix transcriptional regulator [Oenococcus sp. UCMA 17063]